MNIGVDYDDTFTRDPAGWAEALNLLVARGHTVYIVTWRTPEESVRVAAEMAYWKVKDSGIYSTSRQAKMKFMFAQGICIDVVIDDNPSSWLKTMEGWEQ